MEALLMTILAYSTGHCHHQVALCKAVNTLHLQTAMYGFCSTNNRYNEQQRCSLGLEILCHDCTDDQTDLCQSLRGATGGVDTVSPDFLVIDSLLSIPPKDALLPSDPS